MSHPLKTVTTQYAEQILFPSNHWANQSRTLKGGDKADEGSVKQNQSGVEGEKNPVLPMSKTQTSVSEIKFPIHTYATKPNAVSIDDEEITDIGLFESEVGVHAKTIETQISQDLIYSWAPTGDTYAVGTTGTVVPSSLAGTTGTVRLPNMDDFVNALSIHKPRLDENHKEDLSYAVLPDLWYYRLLSDDKLQKQLEWYINPLTGGEVRGLYGIMFYQRSQAGIFDGVSKGKKDRSAIRASTDVNAAILWHPQYVIKARSKFQEFWNRNGSTLAMEYNITQRAGGSFTREDEAGVTIMYETRES